MLTTILSTATRAQTKEEKAVSAAIETLRDAMVDADPATLTRLLADSLSYGHSGGQVQTKAQLIHSLASGESDFVTIRLTDQLITVFNHTAIVRNVLSADTNDGGKPGHVKLAVLWVLQNQHHHWILIARQAVRLSN